MVRASQRMRNQPSLGTKFCMGGVRVTRPVSQFSHPIFNVHKLTVKTAKTSARASSQPADTSSKTVKIIVNNKVSYRKQITCQHSCHHKFCPR